MFKKWFVVIGMVIFCGKEFPEVTQGAYDKNVVIEDLTAVWCVNCPQVHENLKEVKNEFGEKVIIISYHSNINDPFGNQKTEERIKIYHEKEEFPIVIIDGEKKIVGTGSSKEIKKEVESRINCGTDIMFTMQWDGDSLLFKIVSDSLLNVDSLMLLMIIVEDSIFYKCPNGETLLFNVARDIEKSMVHVVPGETISLKMYPKVNESWNSSHIRIAGILQNPENLYIYQGNEINFSVSFEFLVEDTLKEIDTTGQLVEFEFWIKNNNNFPINVKVDTLSSTEIPEDWVFSVCSDVCRPVPFTDEIKENSTKKYSLDVFPNSSGTGIIDLSVSTRGVMLHHKFILTVHP